jgi:exosortase/archaeosortase family protein
VPTDISPSRTRAAEFVLRAAAWSIGIFGLLRLDWIERHGLLPLTQLQGCLAAGLCGTPARPIAATLACSGADVLAICSGAILAYPARWRTRLIGAAAGVALILVLNTLRIGTLGRLAASPSLFDALHVYVWPALLLLAVAGYAFAWMRFADREHLTGSLPAAPLAPVAVPGERQGFRLTRRFALLAAALLLLFTAGAPRYLHSASLMSVAVFVAHAAAAALRLLGIEAQATTNQLWTARGSFLVTQECISTPLIPVYLAAVLAYGGTWRRRLPALLAAAPLFVGLGIVRLLVIALPGAGAVSPSLLIHASFQILLAVVLVACAALWRHPDKGTAARRALLGAGLGFAFVLLLGGPYTSLVAHVIGGPGAAGPSSPDPQGAIAFLPSFQVGLYLALWVAAAVARGWWRFVAGLALLGLLQLATLTLLPLFVGSIGTALQVQGVRAWAVSAPLFVVWLLLLRPPGRRTPVADCGNKGFARG